MCLVLHRASCRTTSTLPPGATRWARDYVKYAVIAGSSKTMLVIRLVGEPRSSLPAPDGITPADERVGRTILALPW